MIQAQLIMKINKLRTFKVLDHLVQETFSEGARSSSPGSVVVPKLKQNFFWIFNLF